MSDENDARTAELWPEGNGPDSADEVDGSTNPLAAYAEEAYLSVAATWLVRAEEEREKLSDAVLAEGGRDYIPRGGGYVLLFESAARLAEVTIAMAMACGTYQTRLETGLPRPFRLAPDPAADVRAAVQADVAEHEAATFRPGIDPEPPEEGVLLTTGDGWFAYAVFPLERDIQRWLLIRRYAQALRWLSAGTRPFAMTWEGLDGTLEYAEHAPPRRPTAEERAAFYGPEPDLVCACCSSGLVADEGIDPHATVCASCDHVVAQHARRVFERLVPAGEAWRSPVTLEPEPDEMYSEGAARAVERCAKVAESAGKTRTAPWLYEVASRIRAGVTVWPDAPAYKGPVLELEGAYRDQLEEISDKAFETLLDAVLNERVRRGRANGTPW